MKKNFNELLQILQNYADEGAKTREALDAINKNANFSQMKKEKDSDKVKAKFAAYGEAQLTKANGIIENIIQEAGKAQLDINAMTGALSYIGITGDKVELDVLESIVEGYRGNIAALKALHSALEGVSAPITAKQLVIKLFFNLKDVKAALENEMQLVIDGGKGASQAARKIVKEAYLLGVDIESSVKDEYGDNMAMRRAAGLL